MLGRRVLVGAVVVAILGIAACVKDEELDLGAAKDGGSVSAEAAASSSSGGGGGDAGPRDPSFNVAGGTPNTPAPGTVCGDITNSKAPTCPAVLKSGQDPTCGESGEPPVCCPGRACIARDATCPDGAPKFPCFSTNQCGDQGICCVAAKIEQIKNPHCNGDQFDATLDLTKSSIGTSCAAACQLNEVQLCHSNDECKVGKCKSSVRILIPSPLLNDPFARVVGVCVPN